MVDEQGIRPQPKKVEPIKNMPPPTNIQEVRRFLGMVGFHRTMIPDYASYSSQLSDLTRKYARWTWEPHHQAAFDHLRTILAEDVIQHHPDVNKPYELYTDASAVAVGAVLVQRDDQGNPRPVQFLSHTLNNTQRLWPAMEREAYAIVYALQMLRPYLYGAVFTVYTDHKPLKAMFQNEIKNTKVQRWAMLIAEYGAPIQYIKGPYNQRADFLSRILVMPENIRVPMQVASFHEQDNFYCKLLQADGIDPEQFRLKQQQEFDMDSDKDLILYENLVCTTLQHKNWPEYPRLWVPTGYKNHIWSTYHEHLGHAGNRKVIRQVGIYYRCPAMWKTGATNYMRCGLCRVHSEQQQHSPPTNMPVAQLPGDLVAADLVGPFPISPKGNRYILTIMDHATAWVEAYPIPSKSQEHVISRFHTHYFP